MKNVIVIEYTNSNLITQYVTSESLVSHFLMESEYGLSDSEMSGLVFPPLEHQTDPTVNELSTMNDWDV